MSRPYAAPVPEPSTPPAVRARRPPPDFRRVVVARVVDRTPRLRRLTLGGPELVGFPTAEPAASVRLLPSLGGAVELPTWNGNEWLSADGSRPPIRTLTPVRIAVDPPEDPEVDVDVVLHGPGPLSSWAATVEPGAPAALAGVGQGYELDPDATHLVLAGDESARPAIEQLLGVMPPDLTIQVVVELASPDARLDLPDHPGATVTWCDDLVRGAGVGRWQRRGGPAHPQAPVRRARRPPPALRDPGLLEVAPEPPAQRSTARWSSALFIFDRPSMPL
jgi:NADPH-dependent ferric siderophore reductase